MFSGVWIESRGIKWINSSKLTHFSLAGTSATIMKTKFLVLIFIILYLTKGNLAFFICLFFFIFLIFFFIFMFSEAINSFHF